jgi:hypothetical protein
MDETIPIEAKHLQEVGVGGGGRTRNDRGLSLRGCVRPRP